MKRKSLINLKEKDFTFVNRRSSVRFRQLAPSFSQQDSERLFVVSWIKEVVPFTVCRWVTKVVFFKGS